MSRHAANTPSLHPAIGTSLLDILLVLLGALLAWWLLPLPTEGLGL